MSKKYYAVNYRCGLAVNANTGDRYAADYHSFPSQKERDAWVSKSGDYRTSPDYREALFSNDRELRAVQRRADSDWGERWTGAVEHHDGGINLELVF